MLSHFKNYINRDITLKTEVKFSKLVFDLLIFFSSMASNGTKARPYRKASVSLF